MQEPEHVVVHEFEFDDWNIEHLLRHDVTPEVVLRVWSDAPVFVVNAPSHAASHLMTGRVGREFWTVAIAPIDEDEGVWYPVTGWPSTKLERTAWFARN